MVNRIQQLDDETIGHIAAGEVVERPAQVVKELIENSLDANANQITVTIENGGFDLIMIDDNGHGINREDIPLSVDRHATSKLSNFSDLNEIYTLGFRGEALASIGMVSLLTVASRIEGENGNSITVSFGKKNSIEQCGMSYGTTISVRDLFKNTPARLSFQRRPATEGAKIVDVIVSHAISNNEVGFKLISDEKTILNVPKSENLADRLYDILGGQASELIELEAPKQDSEAPGKEKWSGWISTPDITRGKGDEVYILINDRPVASGPFHQSIRRGYKTRLMQGRHPIAVLSLEIPAGEVDVNVHPTKREVRLKHSWRVLERLERAIANTLEQVATEPDNDGSIIGLASLNRDVNPIQESLLPAQNDQELTSSPQEPNSTKNDSDNSVPAWAIAAGVQLNLGGSQVEKTKSVDKPRPMSTSEIPQETLPGLDSNPIAPALSSAERDLHRHAKNAKSVSPNDELSLESEINIMGKMEPLAQFADSYIIVQAEEELLLIDQHALHERVRYERLKNIKNNWDAQKLISPLVIQATKVQIAVANSSIEKLLELGFEIITDEDKISLLSHPMLLDGRDIEPLFKDLLQDLSDDGSPLSTLEKIQDHVAFMKSCRGAVKANEKLSLSEMRRLIDDMRRIPNPWACVHGRPTALRINIDSLDHHFGRHG